MKTCIDGYNAVKNLLIMRLKKSIYNMSFDLHIRLLKHLNLSLKFYHIAIILYLMHTCTFHNISY